MRPLLFLTHRIPYPPNKGDKIRSYHLLKFLATFYQIHLGTFVDSPEDWQYVPEVARICESTCIRPLHPKWATLRSSLGLFSGTALTLPYYRDSRLRAWVLDTLRSHQIDRAVLFSSSMAQYVLDNAGLNVRCVVDFVDVDSDKWRQYSKNTRWPMRSIYRREARRLLEFERHVADVADASFFVSREEAALFANLAPAAAAKVGYFENGVDLEYFDPRQAYENPFGETGPVLVFTGAMDYWANVDAVVWFAEQILPIVRMQVPDCRFFVVGARPTDTVQRLKALPGVSITGAVADMRPFLAHARAAVVPLRIARGVQNKVLEALAMKTPVVATSMAMEGLASCANDACLVADDKEPFAAACVNLLQASNNAYRGHKGRECAETRYRWDINLRPIADALHDR